MRAIFAGDWKIRAAAIVAAIAVTLLLRHGFDISFYNSLPLGIVAYFLVRAALRWFNERRHLKRHIAKLEEFYRQNSKENPTATGLSLVAIVLLISALIMGIMVTMDYTVMKSEPPQWLRWAFWASLDVGLFFSAAASFMRRPRR